MSRAITNILQEPPQLSAALYKKARDDNGGLSKLERILLFSRCDLIGKAMADGAASLNEAQMNEVLLRPPPDVMTQNIREVTDGAMSSIADLMAADITTLGERVLCCIPDEYWTGRTAHLKVGPYYRDGPYLEALATKAGKSLDFCGPPPVQEQAKFLCEPKAEREFTRKAVVAWSDLPAPSYWSQHKSAESGTQPPATEEERAAQTERRRAEYVAEGERLRGEMREQLATRLADLTDAELAELRELAETEREKSKKEEEEVAAKRAQTDPQKIDSMQEYEEEREVRREERKAQREAQAEKRKRLGLEEEGEEEEEEDDDDDEDLTDYEELDTY